MTNGQPALYGQDSQDSPPGFEDACFPSCADQVVLSLLTSALKTHVKCLNESGLGYRAASSTWVELYSCEKYAHQVENQLLIKAKHICLDLGLKPQSTGSHLPTCWNLVQCLGNIC